jgi:carbon monoxide dehydrogenase subunit G
MATLVKEISVAVSPEAAWDAISDFGNVHERLVPGFLTASRLDGDARIVTFANGIVLREPLVSRQDGTRRLVYGALGGRFTHYNAALQVFETEAGSRIVWTVDLLPDEFANVAQELMTQAAVIIKRTLESQGAVKPSPRSSP